MMPGEIITDLVNRRLIEEVPEGAVSDRSHVVADQMAVSMAISLKRIADALDSSGDGGRVQGSVLHWLEIMASAANAGRS